MKTAYDYVIVGGGSAGCVLANRLSEDPNVRVLLLEAGGSSRKPLVRLAFGYAKTIGSPQYDWCFKQGPEAGLNNRILPYPRGKVLGGSSSINAMMYVRGLKSDYDAWAAEGLTEWGWSGMEPYLRKMEDYPEPSPNARGKGGPMKISLAPNFHQISQRMVDAAADTPIGKSPDYNGEVPTGIGCAQMFYRDGRRSGSAAAYLEPVERRPNLTVQTGATAEKVLLEGRVAKGVRYLHDGVIQEAYGHEVILSAGAIGSPHLLELSGIGQAERLQALGIETVQHLPQVGEHLQDHCLVFIGQNLHGIRGMGEEFSGWRALVNSLNYLLFRRGQMDGAPSQVAGHAVVDVNGEQINLQLIGMPMGLIRDEKSKAISHKREPAMMLGCYVCSPMGHGHVHATSAAVSDKPTIVTNFMTHERDIKATVEGMKLIRQVFASPEFDDIRGAEYAPGAAASSDEDLIAYARASGASGYHPVGSCRMGVDAERGVVDAALKVHGIAGLRVVDASVMPRLVSANTHAPTVAIAEKAADILRADRFKGG